MSSRKCISPENFSTEDLVFDVQMDPSVHLSSFQRPVFPLGFRGMISTALLPFRSFFTIRTSQHTSRGCSSKPFGIFFRLANRSQSHVCMEERKVRLCI